MQPSTTTNLSYSSSAGAENALQALANDFFESEYQDAGKVPIMNFGALKKKEFSCSDICPLVKVDLIRYQDRTSSKRAELARIVCKTMQSCLSTTFTGDAVHSKLVLRVNIGVVSDGSSPRNSQMLRLLGRGKAHGHGLAKLVVSYCLFSRVTGQVAVAKQLCQLEDCDGGCPNELAVLDLVPDMHKKIVREVKFLCGCHAQVEVSKKRATTTTTATKSLITNVPRFSVPLRGSPIEEEFSCSTTSNNEDDDDSFAL